LHEHPNELAAFWDFHYVQEYKLFIAIEESFGRGAVSEKTASDLKARYDAVKETFKVPLCKERDTYRVNHTWNRLNFVAMAKEDWKPRRIGSARVLHSDEARSRDGGVDVFAAGANTLSGPIFKKHCAVGL
jgi:hypothetical protein